MTTTSPENDVLTLIERGTDLPTIEDRTGWDSDDISGLAVDNGFVFDLNTFRFYDKARRTPPPSSGATVTERASGSAVARMVGNAMHIMNIEVESGWTRQEIIELAVEQGFGLNAANQRFQRVAKPKPGPAGIVRSPAAVVVDRTPETDTGAESTGSSAGAAHADVVAVTDGMVSVASDSDAPTAPVSPKRRKSGLNTRDMQALDIAVFSLIGVLMGAGRTHLVGTAQTSDEYRDVDVRSILPDAEFDALFGGKPVLWSKFCFLASDWLTRQTGLPVDYQVQRMSEANAKYSGERNPIGVGRTFAGGGDATGFSGQHETPRPVPKSVKPAEPTARKPRLTAGATQSEVRAWALAQGLDVNPRGTVRRDIADAYAAAHQETP